MEVMYDVLIAGGGPAGLLAAKTSASMGLNVCVFEIHKDYHQLLRACSAQFILDDGYEGESLQVKDGRLRFTKSGLEEKYSGSLLEVKNKYYYSPQGNRIQFANEDQSAFALKFDKQRLLKDLAEECRQLGVHFYMKTSVIGGIDYTDYVEVTVNNDGALEKFRGKKMILAEGVNARLTREFHILNDRKVFAHAAITKYYVKDIAGIEPNSWNLYYGVAYHCYSPVIIGPSLYQQNVHEVTISCNHKQRADEIYHLFSTDSPMKKQFRDAAAVQKVACSVMAAESLKTPYKGNVIAIGDCAAFVEVEVQGAMMCGYQAAIAVREELEDKDGFEKYSEWWRRSFEFNSDEYLRVSQGYALVPVYTDDELDYLFRFFGGKRLEGTYSQYKTPKLIWDEINSHIDRIQKERPQIYEKICRNGQLTLADSLGRKEA